MNAYTDRHLLFTNAEYAAAQRELTHQAEGDPTLDAPPVPESDEPECCNWLDS